MSGNRWDVMAIREYTDRTGVNRTNWTRVGAGFTNQNGSINIILEMIPCAVDGEVKLQLQVPLSKEEREAKFGAGGQAMRQEHGNRGARPATGQGFATPHERQQQQQRPSTPQGNAARYGNRGQSQPQQQHFGQQQAAPPPYVPDAGYEEHVPAGPPWTFTADDGKQYQTSDPTQLPTDHPDFQPF